MAIKIAPVFVVMKLRKRFSDGFAQMPVFETVKRDLEIGTLIVARLEAARLLQHSGDQYRPQDFLFSDEIHPVCRWL